MNIRQYIPEPVKKPLRKAKQALHTEKYRIDALLHPAEAKYYCPCCNTKLRGWVSGDFKYRPEMYNSKRYENTEQNVMCPVCRTIPRHRILACWFKKHRFELNGDILYFACERGIKLWLNRNKVKYTTADLYADADLKLDIQNTGMPDDSWDWVICNHVLEHVDDYRQALREIYRILKPSGTLICSFPILEQLPTLIEETEHTEENKAKRVELYGQHDHLRIFGADSEDLLRNAGFQVSRIEGGKCPEAILPIVGPGDYDVDYLFICKKERRK